MDPCEALTLALEGSLPPAGAEPVAADLDSLLARLGGSRGLASAMVGNRAAWSRRAQRKGETNEAYAPALASEMRTVQRWRKGETSAPPYRLQAVADRVNEEQAEHHRKVGRGRREQLAREGGRIRLDGTIQISPPKSERRTIPSRGLNAPGYPVPMARVLELLEAGECDEAGKLLMGLLSDAFEDDGGPAFTVVGVEAIEVRPMAGWGSG